MAENPYESNRYLAEYLLFHYGADHEILPWEFGPREALHFPERTVAAFGRAGVRAGAATPLISTGRDGCPQPSGLMDSPCLDPMPNASRRTAGDGGPCQLDSRPPTGMPAPGSRALDLGCAVGRSTFAMAGFFDHVTGLDYSHRFIAAAEALRAGECLSYDRPDEGGLVTTLQARCPDPAAGDRVAFVQGDAMDLPSEWGNFDGVHAANLLCRLPEPIRLIQRLPGLLRPGGILVLATPCTWLESFTPHDCWLGGFQENGQPVRTIDRLRHLLSPHFIESEARDEPFLIREHARKFQWSVAQLSVWRRRGAG